MPEFKRRLVDLLAGSAFWLAYLLLRLPGRRLALRLAAMPWFSHACVRAADLSFAKKTHHLEKNLRLLYPQMSSEEMQQFRQASMRNLALCVIESMYMSEADFRSVTITGQEYLRDAGDTGIIFVTCHLNNWDLIKLNNHMLGYETSFLYTPIRNPLINRLSQHIRSRFSSPVLRSDTPAFINRIRDGKHVLFMPDIKVKRGRNGARLQFCGKTAWTSTFIADMALKYGRPIVPVYVIRHADNRYEQVFEAPVDQSSGDKYVIQQLINDSMSARVLAQPAAWTLWNTNRWGP